MFRRILVAAAAFLFASSAQGGPVDDDACIVDAFSAAERAALITDLIANGPSGRTVGSSLLDRGRACAASGRWTPEQAGDAGMLAAAILMRDELRVRLTGDGLDHARLDAWFARQSESFRTTAFMSMPRSEVTAILDTLPETGWPAERLMQSIPLVGRYLASLVVIERAGRGMPLLD